MELFIMLLISAGVLTLIFLVLLALSAMPQRGAHEQTVRDLKKELSEIKHQIEDTAEVDSIQELEPFSSDSVVKRVKKKI